MIRGWLQRYRDHCCRNSQHSWKDEAALMPEITTRLRVQPTIKITIRRCTNCIASYQFMGAADERTETLP